MLLIIYEQENGLTLNQIEKYLNCDDNSENKNTINTPDIYREEDFLKENNTFDEMIKRINPDLENFGLLPYLLFKVKANNKKVKRKLIQKILKNDGIDNYEQYLENNFDDCGDFYAVSFKFWNLLMNENEEAPEYINNSDIAEYSILVKEEDLLQEKITLLERENINKQDNEKNKKADKKNKKNVQKKQDNNQKVENQEKEKGNEIKEGENKNNEENKDSQKDKDDSKKNDNNNEAQIVTQLASLKRGKKYREDFIILCGELYKLIKNNYRFDYIIKFRKFQNIIQMKKEKNNNKKEEKKEKKEEKKEEIKEEKKEEVKEEKKEEAKEEEKDEEYIKNEKLIKEKLNKFVVDVDKGLISKIKEGNGCYILNEIDFYPIKVYVQSLGNMVRMIENAKTMYKNLKEAIALLKLPKREQDIIRAEKKKKRDLLNKRKQKYNYLVDNLNSKRMWREIDEKEYAKKASQIQEQFKDLFDKPEKTGSDYVTDITLQEFLDTLKIYRNTLLLEKQNNLTLYHRHKTCKEISNEILKLNPALKNRKIDIYYYLFSSRTIFKPENNYEFEKEGKDSEDFMCIFIDIYNEKGENFNHLLNEKEKEQKINKEESEEQKDKMKEEPKKEKEKKKDKTEKNERTRKENGFGRKRTKKVRKGTKRKTKKTTKRARN